MMDYTLADASGVISPALLLYPEAVKRNLTRMIHLAGDAARLRPHVKTHKLPQVVKWQQQAGIQHFKCSTLAELDMLIECGATDILLAYPLLGPSLAAFTRRVLSHPECYLSFLVDSMEGLQEVKQVAQGANCLLHVWIDLNVGMNRTGITPGGKAFQLAEKIWRSPLVHLAGLHVYDGHIRTRDLPQRTLEVEAAFAEVKTFHQRLLDADIPVSDLVCGGTPSFPIHAQHPDRSLSPGTVLIWDAGYSEQFPDLPFEPAATVFTRVISKPSSTKICLDLGHKAIAAEMPHPRARIVGLEGYETGSHSEEHLTIEVADAALYRIGQGMYAIPMHICPTMALHEEVCVVEERAVVDHWKIVARKRLYY